VVLGKYLEFRYSLTKDITPILFGDQIYRRKITINLAIYTIKDTHCNYIKPQLKRTKKNGGIYLSITVENSNIRIKKRIF